MGGPQIVVKVGGSLFDLPDLGERLRRWLAVQEAKEILLVPGGGPTSDVIRDLDRWHSLGEEQSHWLALRSLSLNAHVLAALLPQGEVVADLAACPPCWAAGRLPILDAHAFSMADEGWPGCLPHVWEVTSDSVAARAAAVAGAGSLVLLKSVTIPRGVDWAEARHRGWVDGRFADVLRQAPGLRVCAVNFHEWSDHWSSKSAGSVEPRRGGIKEPGATPRADERCPGGRPE
jgi:aspartokinase-like uncharacterized kinase